MSGNTEHHSYDLKACLTTQLKQVAQADYSFSELAHQLQDGQGEPAAFQFEVASSDCFSKVTYVKLPESDDLGHFTAVFPAGTELTLLELEAIFGSFNLTPPSPSRVWTAIAYPDQGSFAHPYAVMVRSQAPIEKKTTFREITVRIDRE